MTTVGPNSAASITTIVNGGSYIPWTNVANGRVSDNAYATLAASSTAPADRLYPYDFGFAIAAGQQADGVLLEIEASDPDNSGLINVSGGLMKDAAGNSGGSTVSFGGPITSTDTWYGLGGSTTPWYTPKLTAAQCNASGFGASVSGYSDGASHTLQIDSVRITITHSAIPVGGGYSRLTRAMLGIIGRTLEMGLLIHPSDFGQRQEWIRRELGREWMPQQQARSVGVGLYLVPPRKLWKPRDSRRWFACSL